MIFNFELFKFSVNVYSVMFIIFMTAVIIIHDNYV